LCLTNYYLQIYFVGLTFCFDFFELHEIETNLAKNVTVQGVTGDANAPMKSIVLRCRIFFVSDTCSFDECEWFNIISAYRMQMSKN
jgi:hypothetical protein